MYSERILDRGERRAVHVCVISVSSRFAGDDPAIALAGHCLHTPLPDMVLRDIRYEGREIPNRRSAHVLAAADVPVGELEVWWPRHSALGVRRTRAGIGRCGERQSRTAGRDANRQHDRAAERHLDQRRAQRDLQPVADGCDEEQFDRDDHARH